MDHELVIALIDRAGGHGLVLAAVVVIAGAGGLVYRLVIKPRADRAGSDHDPERAREPEA